MILQKLVDSTPDDELEGLGLPPGPPAQTTHPATHPLDRSDIFQDSPPEGTPEPPPHADYVLQAPQGPDPLSPLRLGDESDPSTPPSEGDIGPSSHSRAGLDQSPIRAPGRSFDNMCEEKAANQARYSKGRKGDDRKVGSKRAQGYIEPPAISRVLERGNSRRSPAAGPNSQASGGGHGTGQRRPRDSQ